MSKLLELMIERQKAYTDCTDEMFKSISHVQDAIMEYLEATPDICQWIDIEVTEGFLILAVDVEIMDDFAVIKDPVTGLTSEVPAVDDDGDRMRRRIPVGLPLELIENGTKDDVLDFLYKADEDRMLSGSEEPEKVETLEEIANEPVEGDDISWDGNTDYNKRTIH